MGRLCCFVARCYGGQCSRWFNLLPLSIQKEVSHCHISVSKKPLVIVNPPQKNKPIVLNYTITIVTRKLWETLLYIASDKGEGERKGCILHRVCDAEVRLYLVLGPIRRGDA